LLWVHRLDGVIVGEIGIAAPFWFNPLRDISPNRATPWRQPPDKETKHVPAERFAGASAPRSYSGLWISFQIPILRDKHIFVQCAPVLCANEGSRSLTVVIGRSPAADTIENVWRNANGLVGSIIGGALRRRFILYEMSDQ
jgi:hypothetical protein